MITREDVDKIWHSTLEIAQMPAPLFKLIAALLKERDEVLAKLESVKAKYLSHLNACLKDTETVLGITNSILSERKSKGVEK